MNDDNQTPSEFSERASRLSAAPPRPTFDDAPFIDEADRPLPHDTLTESQGRKRRVAGAWREAAASFSMPQRPNPAGVSDDERLWATIAHASAWITFFGGIVSIGALIPVSIFIPLVIYFYFRDKSDYIAFHALQAFVIQLVGTVGAGLLLVVGGLVWVIGLVIGMIAMIVLIGFVLVPVWALVGVVAGALISLLPLAMVMFATIGAIETYRGRDYRYPVISAWIERQINPRARRGSTYI
jgi:uncharacterized Tic20 family protein